MEKRVVASFWAIASRDMKFFGTVHIEHESDENPGMDVPEFFDSPVDSNVKWYESRREAFKAIRRYRLRKFTKPVKVVVSIDERK